MATEPRRGGRKDVGRKERGIRAKPGEPERKPGRVPGICRARVCGGSHPENFVDHECAFAARNIRRLAPGPFSMSGLTGISSWPAGSFPVATVDVRNRQPLFPGETVFTGDAKRLDLPDRSFDLVLLSAPWKHLGLGRYGDDLDFEADGKAFREMVRVLKPGGPFGLLHDDHPRRPPIGFKRPPDLQLRHAPGNFAMNSSPWRKCFTSHRLKTSCPLEEVTAAPRAGMCTAAAGRNLNRSPRRPQSTRRTGIMNLKNLKENILRTGCIWL